LSASVHAVVDDIRERPASILIVSDLHLGCGRNGATGRADCRENFFEGEAFRALLEHHAPEPHAPALLILNGDTFDFLRVTTKPRERDIARWADALRRLSAPRPEGVLWPIRWKEREYGLKTDDYKSIWKLLCIERGHDGFFGALGMWVEKGGTIVFVKGNHDLELHWPLVQRAIRLMIADRATRAPASIESSVRFCENGLRLANVYVEHGHRFERLTRVPGPPERPGGTELTYPLGSFVNRYLINRLEGLEPFLDNVKPQTKLLRDIVRRHPVKVWKIARHGAVFLARALRPYWFSESLGFLTFFAAILLPILTVGTIVAALVVPSFGTWLKSILGRWQAVAGLLGLFAPYILGAVRDLWPRRRPKVGDTYVEDEYAMGIHSAMRKQPSLSPFDRAYGVLGHTHRADVQELPSLDPNQHPHAVALYLNTGTWAPLWDDARPDLLGRTVRSFVRFRLAGDRYDHESLEWTWTSMPTAPSRLLEPVEGVA
jgi:UDP-2,3-diacylglucosamine pyrophosphatase LpxH